MGWLMLSFGLWERGFFVKNLCRLPGVRCPEWKCEAAPRADSMEAAHICRCIVSERPSCKKSCCSKCLWDGRSSPGDVFSNSFIRELRRPWSCIVKPSTFWCTSALRNSHCWCVIPSSALMSDIPHLVIEHREGRQVLTISISSMGILPSRKQSHPSSSCIRERDIYLLPNGVRFTMLLAPWRRR